MTRLGLLIITTCLLVLPPCAPAQDTGPMSASMPLTSLTDGYALVVGRTIRLSRDHRFIVFKSGRPTTAWPLILTAAGPGRTVDAGLYCAIENLTLADRQLPEGLALPIARIEALRFPNPAINRIGFVFADETSGLSVYCSIDDNSQAEPIAYGQFQSVTGDWLTIMKLP